LPPHRQELPLDCLHNFLYNCMEATCFSKKRINSPCFVLYFRPKNSHVKLFRPFHTKTNDFSQKTYRKKLQWILYEDFL
jgi:hypothetical protein